MKTHKFSICVDQYLLTLFSSDIQNNRALVTVPTVSVLFDVLNSREKQGNHCFVDDFTILSKIQLL